MSKSSKNVQKKLDIRQRRIFSEEFKKQKVEMLIQKKISIHDLCELYKVSKVNIYRWLYRYSPHHNKGTTQVIQMESEVEKTKYLQQRLAELERLVGQKQIKIDYLEKMIELASEELKTDIKKNYVTQQQNGSDFE
jgi:transposase